MGVPTSPVAAFIGDMSEPRGIQTPPVRLTEPYGDLPTPDPNCPDCTAWVKVRDEARERQDYAAAAIASTELLLHNRKEACRMGASDVAGRPPMNVRSRFALVGIPLGGP